MLCQKSSPWSQGKKTPPGRGENVGTTYSPYKEETVVVPKYSGKSDTSKETRKRKTQKMEMTQIVVR